MKKNIIPPRGIKRGSKYGFESLKKYGDFVFIEDEQKELAKPAAYQFAKNNGFKVAVRQVDGGVNIYRAGDTWVHISDIAERVIIT